jgi:hypothetical protein
VIRPYIRRIDANFPFEPLPGDPTRAHFRNHMMRALVGNLREKSAILFKLFQAHAPKRTHARQRFFERTHSLFTFFPASIVLSPSRLVPDRRRISFCWSKLFGLGLQADSSTGKRCSQKT